MLTYASRHHHHHHDSPLGRVLASAFKWALPRLGIYVAAAITGAVLFGGWAVFYTYVWPGAPVQRAPGPWLNLPPLPPQVLPIHKEPVVPNDGPNIAQSPIVGRIAEVALSPLEEIEAPYIGTPVFGSENQLVGHVSRLLFNADGAPKAVIVSLRCKSCETKDVAIPFQSVKWIVMNSVDLEEAVDASLKQMNLPHKKIQKAVITHSVTDLEKSTNFELKTPPPETGGAGKPKPDGNH
ncbi:MAG: PRC-barrel domain-containing protein [Ktedonobacteraceae bacterium]